MVDIRRLTGKEVLVKAAGISYSGILVEVGIDAVVLKSPSGHREVPLDKIISIDEAGKSGGGLPPSPLKRAGR